MSRGARRYKYPQVIIQMYLLDWDMRMLSSKSGIPYTSLTRKMRGASPMHLDEARKIQKALDCGMSLDVLFTEKQKADSYVPMR